MQKNFPYQAKVLITQRRYQEAIQICRDGLQANPNHVEGKVLLGMALLALRQYDQVCKEVEPLVKNEPGHALAHRLLGEAHLGLGHTAQARTHLEEAKKAQPDSPATLELLEELDRAAATGGKKTKTGRKWADPNETITVSNRTPLLSDDDEQTATTSEMSPMVLPDKAKPSSGDAARKSSASRPLASLVGFEDDDVDETIVGDMPAMEEIKKAFPPSGSPNAAKREHILPEARRIGAEPASSTVATSSLTPLVDELDDEEEETLSATVPDDTEAPLPPPGNHLRGKFGSAVPDEAVWADEDETIATTMPEYKRPPDDASGGGELGSVDDSLDVPSVIISDSVDMQVSELEETGSVSIGSAATMIAPSDVIDEVEGSTDRGSPLAHTSVDVSIATLPLEQPPADMLESGSESDEETKSLSLDGSVDAPFGNGSVDSSVPPATPGSLDAPPRSGSVDSSAPPVTPGSLDATPRSGSVDSSVPPVTPGSLEVPPRSGSVESSAPPVTPGSLDAPAGSGSHEVTPSSPSQAATTPSVDEVGQEPDTNESQPGPSSPPDAASIFTGASLSVDFNLDPDGYAESPFGDQFDISPSVAQSLDNIGSQELPQGEQSLDIAGASETGQQGQGEAESAKSSVPPPVPMGPPDPEATRVLDAASAAIIRAQSGAPLKNGSVELRDLSGASQDHVVGFSDEPLRDLEGTDSFSALAEGTMVDEESLAEVREKLLASKDIDDLGPSIFDRTRPVTSEEIVDPRALGFDDFGSGDSSSPGQEARGKAKSSDSSPPIPGSADIPTSKEEREQKRGGEARESRRLKAPDLADRFAGIQQVAKRDRSSPPSIPGGRDPGISTAVLSSKKGAGSSDEEPKERRTVPEVPGTTPSEDDSQEELITSHGDRKLGSPQPMTRDLGSVRPESERAAASKGSDKPGAAPKFIETATSPTALAVPAYKPDESAGESPHLPLVPPSPPAPVESKPPPKPKKTLIGFGAPSPAPNPLENPLDPGDFPRASIPLPEADTSIPLRTGDLLVTSSGIAEEELSTTPPSFPKPTLPERKRKSEAPPPPPMPPPVPPVLGDSENPLEEPFRPEDFSSHRIPLPEARPQPEVFDLESPLSPDDFGSSKAAAPIRPLPPVSPLDQPISPDDFTPGPRRKSELPDPLNEPFWPEDFEEGGKAEIRSKAFRFGRTEAPKPAPPKPPSPPNVGLVAEDDLETRAVDGRRAAPGYAPPAPPAPQIERSAPPPPPAPSAPPGPPIPPGPPVKPPPAVPTIGEFPPPPPPDFTPAIPREGLAGSSPPMPPGVPVDIPSMDIQHAPDPFDEPRGRKHTEPIKGSARDALLEPQRPQGPEPQRPGPQKPSSPPKQQQGRAGKQPNKGPKLKNRPELEQKRAGGKSRVGQFIALGAVVLVLFVGITIGVVLYLGAAEIEERRLEAQTALERGNHQDYVTAARIYENLIAANDDHELLSEAARVHAMTALEFGTDDDDTAETLIHRAKAAGAPDQKLAPARAAIDIYRGDLAHADKVLNATQSSTGDDAPELIYLRGLWYLRQDDPREALRRFAAASQANPRDVRMVLAQALALYAQGSLQGALQKLDEVEGLSSKNVASRLLRAKINIETGRHPAAGDQAAREVLESLSSQSSSGQLGWAKLLQARYFIDTDKVLQARDHAVSARDSRPVRDAEFSSLLARTLLDLNDPTEARQEAKRAVELSPRLSRYRLVLAEALLEVGELSSAEEHLRPITGSAKASLLLGMISLKRGDLAGAERRFGEAAQGEREAPQAKLSLARIYLKQRRTDQAIKLLEQLAAGPPENPLAKIDLGEAYLTTDQLTKAQSVLEQASKELPNNPRVSINLGKLYARQGAHDKAVRAVQKALTIQPGQPEALVTLGELQLSGGNMGEAADAFDQAIKAQPANTAALIGRARVHTERREFDQAGQMLSKAAGKADPGRVELARGELSLRRYDPRVAVPELQKAVKALPTEAIGHTLLGEASVMLGDRSSLRDAKTAFSKALKLQRNEPRALIGKAELALFGTNISRTKRAIDKAVGAFNDGGLSNTLKARVYNLKGRYQFEIKGNSSGARDHLAKAVEIDDHLAEAHLSLGFVNEDLSRSTDACRHFKRYIELASKGNKTDVSEARRGQRDNCR